MTCPQLANDKIKIVSLYIQCATCGTAEVFLDCGLKEMIEAHRGHNFDIEEESLTLWSKSQD